LAQWRSIFNGLSDIPGYAYSSINSTNTYNSWSWYSSGGTYGAYREGTLFLPAAGRRDNSDGNLDSAGSVGYYWSSSVSGTNSYNLLFNSSNVYLKTNSLSRAHGRSVRCVAEESN
jgi:uncharacterized protein (TIGR02145 family)